MEAGVAGFLTKRERAERIVDAVRRAARGEALTLDGQRARAFLWQQEVGARWERLTNRERQVLRLLVQGRDNQAIADALCVSVNTVRCHCKRIYAKLEVADRAEAIAFYVQHGLADLTLEGYEKIALQGDDKQSKVW